MKRKTLVVGAVVLLVLMVTGAAIAAEKAQLIYDNSVPSVGEPKEPNGDGGLNSGQGPNYAEMFQGDEKLTLENTSSPEGVLLVYFKALYSACNLPEDNKVPISGTIGRGQEPYPEAYACWSKVWRDETSYEEYLKSWEGTVNVELLKLVSAGEENGRKRYFVETRNMEAIQDSTNPRMGVFCYKGYVTMANTGEGWRIAEYQLTAEDPSWYIAGHQPWLADPAEVAQIVGLGVPMGEETGTRVVENNEDGSLKVRFQDDNGKDTHKVFVVQTQDKICQVVSSQSL